MRQAQQAPGAAFGSYSQVIGESPAIRTATALAAQIAASRSLTVLLVGETGTGKELFARGIHGLSARADAPFVAINCAAIPETLLESELFGYERGSFTDALTRKRGLLELAGAGTVFLDEVAELPLKLQAKLLRVVEERRFRPIGATSEQALEARIIAGSNIPLERVVAKSQFRADLFYRLNVARLDLPPLRERGKDVVLLAKYFLRRHSEADGRSELRFSAGTLKLLAAHRWPGNIRELKNVIERALLLCQDNVIEQHHLSLQMRALVPLAKTPSATRIVIPPGGQTLQSIIDEAVHVTVGLTGGNLSAAARILGISRPTLARRLRVETEVNRSILASS